MAKRRMIRPDRILRLLHHAKVASHGLRKITYGQSRRSTVGDYCTKDLHLVENRVGHRVMADNSPLPVFTGADLALADALILIIKVMAMHGVLDPEAIDTVFSDMENRYRGQHLNSAAAMAEYLRQHAIGDDHDLKLLRLRSLLDEAPEGSA